MNNLKFNQFQIDCWALQNLDNQRKEYRVELTDYQHSSACIIAGNFEYVVPKYNRHVDMLTHDYARFLKYFLHQAAHLQDAPPKNYQVIDTVWFRKQTRYKDLTQNLVRMQKLNKAIDKVYHLSNFATEDIIDWDNCDIEDRYPVKLFKSKNKYQINSAIDQLKWSMINPFQFNYSFEKDPAVVYDFIWSDMLYQDCLEFVFRLQREIDQN